MPSNETLFTIAELSLALAGFSGLVVGLRGMQTGEIQSQDRIGLSHILLSSGAALVFSLLPPVLVAAGIDTATAWKASSLALAVVILCATAAVANSARRTPPRSPWVFWPLLVLGLGVGGGLGAVTLRPVSAGASLLPLALLWLLVVGFVQFAVFLVLLWWRPGRAPAADGKDGGEE